MTEVLEKLSISLTEDDIKELLHEAYNSNKIYFDENAPKNCFTERLFDILIKYSNFNITHILIGGNIDLRLSSENTDALINNVSIVVYPAMQELHDLFFQELGGYLPNKGTKIILALNLKKVLHTNNKSWIGSI